MILDAALKLSNDIAKLLYCVDDKSTGKNELDASKIMAELVLDEKQMSAMLKLDDDLPTIDLSELEVTEITPEQFEKEEAAANTMKAVTEEIKIFKNN